MASLSELRDIEQQRIADEHAAIEHARMAEIEARRAAEQARIDAEQARIRDEREALLRIEQARLDAEREARMRVEAAEAAERMRAQAELEQRRLDEEMAIRRAEVLQKRPRWMVAVTAIAVVAAVVLIWVAIDNIQHARVASEQARIAELERTKAVEAAKQAQLGLAKIEHELEALDERVTKAQNDLIAAQTDAERKRIAAEIAETNRQKSEAKKRRADAEKAAEIAAQKAGFKFKDRSCIDTAVGCLDTPKKK